MDSVSRVQKQEFCLLLGLFFDYGTKFLHQSARQLLHPRVRARPMAIRWRIPTKENPPRIADAKDGSRHLLVNVRSSLEVKNFAQRHHPKVANYIKHWLKWPRNEERLSCCK